MPIFEKIVQLVNENTNFVNDEAEMAVLERDAALVNVQRTALLIEQLAAQGNVEDAELEGVAEAIVDLASQFGTTFKNLSADQKARVKATVAGIVTGKNEVLIETLFDSAFDLVGKALALTEVMDRLLATPPPPPEGRAR